MTSSLRTFREDTRRGRGNLDPLQLVEGFLDEALPAATNVLTGATRALFTVIEWQDDGINGGNWNASTNSPALSSGSGTVAKYYTVSVAGSTSLDGTSSWTVGDVVQFNGTTWARVSELQPANFYEASQPKNDKGDWNASTNTPAISSGTGVLGDFYRVSRSGTTEIDDEDDWDALDIIYFDGETWVKKSAAFLFYVTNRDTSLSLASGSYIVAARLNGEWRIVWCSCYDVR